MCTRSGSPHNVMYSSSTEMAESVSLLTCVYFPYTVMFHAVTISHREGIISWLALTLTDQEGATLVAHLKELLLSICSLDFTKEPPGERRREGE